MNKRALMEATVATTLTVTMGLSIGCHAGSTAGVCEQAADHVADCLGHGEHSGEPLMCDPAEAAATLELGCESIIAAFGESGDDVKTDSGWASALGCWLGLTPLEDCVIDGNYRGYWQRGTVLHAGAEGRPAASIVVRFRHEKLQAVVVETTSNARGDFEIKVPGTAFKAQPYQIEVLLDGKVAASGAIRINFGFSWYAEIDGDTASICRWADDDYCAGPGKW
jgi:hypothetical protein